MYEELTGLIPFTDKKNAEKWISRIEDKKIIDWIIYAVKDFVKKHNNPIFHHYDEILEVNNILWSEESVIHIDISELDGNVVLALLIGAVNDKPLGNNTVNILFENGSIRKWLLRLKEIDFMNARRDIIDITIRSRSGYVPAESAFKDELTILSDRIYYQYTPKYYSDHNSDQFWTYQITNKKLFDELVEAVLLILHRDERDCPICDVGEISFSVSYGNGLEEKRTFWESPKEFQKFFEIIKQMLPPDEETPKLIEDYEYSYDEESGEYRH